MVTVVYDKTFEGFLSAVFDVYEYKYTDVHIVQKGSYNTAIFNKQHVVETRQDKALRVWKGLLQYLSNQDAKSIYETWLSELKDIEQTLLEYIKYVFSAKKNVAADYSNQSVLRVTQLAKKVSRERHRMTAFVRFQLTADGIYFALVEPDFNVLPLIITHFEKRYADQRWLIYDVRRKYGIFYNLKSVESIEMNFAEDTGNLTHEMFDEKESLYQKLWQKYFGSVNIQARKNTKLHVQHMPKRYWKYLTEKKV